MGEENQKMRGHIQGRILVLCHPLFVVSIFKMAVRTYHFFFGFNLGFFLGFGWAIVSRQ